MHIATLFAQIVDILRPGMLQMKELLTFITEAVEVFHQALLQLSMKTGASNNSSFRGLYYGMFSAYFVL